VLGIVALASALHLSIDGFDRGVDVDQDSGILQPAQLPDPFTQDARDFQQGVGLIDPQAVDIASEGAGCRQPGEFEKTAEHGIEPKVDKVPDPVKTDKQEHQNAHHHRIVSQLGITGWGPVSEVKDFPKTDQIDKFDQRQKPAEWAQLRGTGFVSRGSVDFSGPRAFFTKPFTAALFPGSLISSFYHLGTSCRSCLGLAEPLL
jgi:hypothetical protein